MDVSDWRKEGERRRKMKRMIKKKDRTRKVKAK